MDIKTAKYVKQLGADNNISISIKLVDKPNVDIGVPLDPDNADYQEILKQVKAGTLTIKDAD